MIDAHFHCWQLARNDYGWLTPELAPIYRDVSVADWQQQAQAWGVNGGLLVQAAPTPQETTYLLRQAQAHPAVLGVLGWIDMLAPDAVHQVARALEACSRQQASAQTWDRAGTPVCRLWRPVRGHAPSEGGGDQVGDRVLEASRRRLRAEQPGGARLQWQLQRPAPQSDGEGGRRGSVLGERRVPGQRL